MHYFISFGVSLLSLRKCPKCGDIRQFRNRGNLHSHLYRLAYICFKTGLKEKQMNPDLSKEIIRCVMNYYDWNARPDSEVICS